MNNAEKFREHAEKENEKLFKKVALSDKLQKELGITDDEVDELKERWGRLDCGFYEIKAEYRNSIPNRHSENLRLNHEVEGSVLVILQCSQ